MKQNTFLYFFALVKQSKHYLGNDTVVVYFKVESITKKKRKKLRQLYHKGLLIFLILPILELLTSRVRFVKALALSSASWNASLILSSVCVILVSFLNSMVKRTITLPFLSNRKRKVTKCQ